MSLLLLFVIFAPLLAYPQGDKITYAADDDNDVLSRFRQFEILPSRNSSKNFLRHPEASTALENGEYFQGDMRLSPEQEQYYLTDADLDGEDGEGAEGIWSRTGILNTKFRWPKDKEGKVNVPYKIEESANFSSYEISMIKLAFADLQEYTCVRFRPHTTEPDYISIISGRGCHSRIGKIGGKQEVSYQKGGCFSRGTIIHELIHTLGYDHMQNHAERDTYITINFDNINTNQRHNFERVDPKKYNNFGTPYDYISVMHYGPKAFSKNGKETITPKQAAFKDKIGQRKGLSVGDAQRINNMYECQKAKL
ncbi:high choriolytic enzyme 1-like [Chironomus tepperi]|uniref:high choriolytic enzyme 1-like n=1 Tax=Chironomus tepperi TaxID=113505 RepID=UPI00391F384E